MKLSLEMVVSPINPIAVKEFRQAVRSNLVVAILTIFLVVNLAVVGGFLLVSPDALSSKTGGQEVFMGLAGILFFTCVGFVPLYTAVRLSLERNDSGMDLLYVTTIRPGALVRGKYLAAMADASDLACLHAVPRIYGTFARGGSRFGRLDPADRSFALRRSQRTGGLRRRRWRKLDPARPRRPRAGGRPDRGNVSHGPGDRGDDGVWGADGLAGKLFAPPVAGVGADRDGRRGSPVAPRPALRFFGSDGQPTVRQPDVCAAALRHGGLGDGRGDRRFWSVFDNNEGPLGDWSITMTLLFTVLLIPVIGERDAWGLRVRRAIPQRRSVRRLAFSLYTGSAGGLLWCVAMVAATILVGVAQACVFHHPYENYESYNSFSFWWVLLPLFAYVFSFLKALGIRWGR